jgi:small subunit ribosomal protein S16
VGKTHHPSYRLVVADKPVKRDGAFLETLGSYDPHTDPPTVTLNEEATRTWLGKGAPPSEAAEKILRRAGIISTPAKAGPSAKGKAAAGKPAATAKAPAAPKAAAAPEESAAEAEPEAAAEAE